MRRTFRKWICLAMALTLCAMVLAQGAQTGLRGLAKVARAEETAERTRSTEPMPEPTAEPTAEPTVEPTVAPTAEPTVAPTTEPAVAPTTEPTESTAEPTTEPALEATPESPLTRQGLESYLETLSLEESKIKIACVDEQDQPLAQAPETMRMGALKDVAPDLEGYQYQYATVEKQKVTFVCLYEGELYYIADGKGKALAQAEKPRAEIRLTYFAIEPTAEPTAQPTVAPTAKPTVEPTAEPTAQPTAKPTAKPTAQPTVEPTAEPTATPTAQPTVAPTAEPTVEPTVAPTAEPTVEPTAQPTAEPTAEPTPAPTVGAQKIDDKATGVGLMAEAGALDAAAELIVSVAESAPLEEALSRALFEKELYLQGVAAYEISLSGARIVPGASVRVLLPVPAEFTGEISAWHIGADGAATRMPGAREGEVYCFETTHFSQFALVSAVSAEELTPPEPMTVDFLYMVMGVNGDGEPLAPNAAPSSVGVTCYDQNGALLTAEGVPTSVSLGAISRVAPATFDTADGRHYRLARAMVDGDECVIVGVYQDELYYSTNGNTAVKMEDRPLYLFYQEYYRVTFNQAQPSWGEVTANGALINQNTQIVEINAGQELSWSVKTKDTFTTKIRYRIASILVNGEALSGYDEYNRTVFDRTVNEDTAIDITFANDGHYRVFFDTTHLVVNSETKVNSNQSWTDPNQAVIPANNGYSNGDPTSTEKYLTLRVYVPEGMRISALSMNGIPLGVPEEMPGLPGIGDSVTQGTNAGNVTTPDTKIDYVISVKAIRPWIGSDLPRVSGVKYIYEITVSDQRSNHYGIQEDLYFIPKFEMESTPHATLQIYTDNVRGGVGLDVGHWENPSIVSAQDGTQYVMENPSLSRKKVQVFFAKAKPGFVYDRAEYGGTSGGSSTSYTGSIDAWNSDLGLTDLNNQDPNSAVARAKEEGYDHYFIAVGKTTAANADSFTVSIYANSVPAYITYDGNGGDDPVSNVPAPAEGAFRAFIVGGVHEIQAAPAREGYTFLGWQLKSARGTLYQPGDRFDILSENFELATGTATYNGGAVENVYQFEAVWAPAAPVYQYTIEFWLKGEQRDQGDPALEWLGKTETRATPSGNKTIFLMPPENYQQSGYEYDAGDPRNVTVARTTDAEPFTGTLRLYFKEKTVTMLYRTNDEALGMTNPSRETRKYWTGDRFSGSTATPAWGCRFEGWWIYYDGEDYYPETWYQATTDATLTAQVVDGGKGWGQKTDGVGFTAYFTKMYTSANLTIGKAVEGLYAERQRPFAFTITATPPEGWTGGAIGEHPAFAVSGLGDTATLRFDENGRATLRLKEGQQAVVSGLPAEWTYRIEETQAANYTTTYALDGGDAQDGSACELTLASEGNMILFTNTSVYAPPMGLNLDCAPWRTLLLLACGLMALFALARRRNP